MHTDPIMPVLTACLIGIIVIGLIMRRLKQPFVVAYILAGVFLGPHCLRIVSDQDFLTRLGAIGVLLLLFFVGMEISPVDIIANWRISVIGTLLQILASVGCVAVIGVLRDWPASRILLIGFVISLSSTSVIIKMLRDWNEHETEVGRDVIGILLVQDLAIIPMLIMLGFFGGGGQLNVAEIVIQVIGGLAILRGLIWITNQSEKFHLPFGDAIRHDHELQIYVAAALCFGLALCATFIHLPPALGAFCGGILIASIRETDWIHHSLEPFHVVFVACFFVSIGMLVDLAFVREHIVMITQLVVAAYLTNLVINSCILRCLGLGWRRSIYSGILLSQIGEFSFVFAAVGVQLKIINAFAYQTTIAVIALTLLLSPILILGAKKFQLDVEH